MSKRHKDALDIIDGACNPRAILSALRNAINELDGEAWKAKHGEAATMALASAIAQRLDVIPGPTRYDVWADTPTICNDPAIRLMVFQLAYLTKYDALDAIMGEWAWSSTVDQCRAKAGEPS